MNLLSVTIGLSAVLDKILSSVFILNKLLISKFTETETQAGDDFRFFRGTYPGIQLRVNTTSSVRIALTSFDIPHNPMLEIAIGGNNNSLTQIIRNQDQVVVSVPTPNVLNRESFTGFRITWSQHVVLVSREDQQFPFLAYSMDDWFAVNFYGLQG